MESKEARQIRRRIDIIELLAKGDDAYCAMLLEIRELERRYDAVLCTLPIEQQDTICDFVSRCEAMSQRMLELACTYMRFPE